MIRKEISDLRLRWLIILFLVVATVFTLPLARQMVTSVDLSSMPESFQKMINLPFDFTSKMKDWNFYMLSQWQGKNFGQFIPIIAVILIFSSISKERENGTLDFLVTRQGRKKVFMAKYSVSIISALTLVFIANMLVFPVSLINGQSMSVSPVLKFTLVGLVATFFWSSMAFFFTTIFTEQVKPLIFSLIAVFGEIIFSYVKPLKFLNTYSYILGSDILYKGTFSVPYSLVLVAIGAGLSFITYKIFMEYDI